MDLERLGITLFGDDRLHRQVVARDVVAGPPEDIPHRRLARGRCALRDGRADWSRAARERDRPRDHQERRKPRPHVSSL